MLHQDHAYHETMTGYSKQNWKVKMGREGEKGGHDVACPSVGILCVRAKMIYLV